MLGIAADASADDMGRAIDAARRAFDDTDWSTNTELRVRCIRQLQEALTKHVEDLREITIAEVGAPRMLTSVAQLEGPIADLSFCADTAESYQWTTDVGIASPMGIKTHRTIARRPSASSARSPRGTSRTRSTSPSSDPHWPRATPSSSSRHPTPRGAQPFVGELIAEHTDIPPGVVNIVTSSDHAVGALLSKDPRVDMVSFTGSTATGRAVMADGAATLKKVFLELGGKSAFLVLDDADLAGRVLDVGVHRVDARRAGMRDHHPAGGAARPLRRGRRGGGGHHGLAQARRPERTPAPSAAR